MVAFTRPAPTGRHREQIADVIAAAIDLARENARVGRDVSVVQIETNVPEALSLVVARHAVVMAMANVIKNAIEACLASESDEPRICVSAEAADDAVTIRVADNGIGMSDEEKRNCSLAVPGRRNKTKRFSTGYGLPIAARNLAAHGGSLTITSKENEGTTVTMTFPLETDE